MSCFGGPEILNAGLVGYWDAENYLSYSGSGTAWIDIIGDATANSANAPTYNANGYYTFNGTNQYASAGDLAAFDFGTGSATIDMWIRTNGTYSDSITRRIIAKGASADGVGGEGFAIVIYGTIYAIINTAGSATRITTTVGSINFSVGEWMNITLVIDRSTNYMTIYKNAGKDGTVTTSTTIGTGSISSTSSLSIGALVGGNFFNGDIALVRGYNRALSLVEMKQNFNALRGRFGI